MSGCKQGVLIEKIVQYLKIKGYACVPEYINLGVCYGLSVIHSVAPKFLEAAVERIAGWNGNDLSFSEEVTLPGKSSITLEKLFEMVINLVCFHQEGFSVINCAEQKNKLEALQCKFLQPDEIGPFEFLIKKEGSTDYAPSKIKNCASVAGGFTGDDLTAILLNLPSIFCAANGPVICLVHEYDHTCSLRYDKDKWFFYDPNYDDGMEKEFDLHGVLEEIKKYLTGGIAIEVATFDKDSALSFPAYERIIREKPAQVLGEYGLHMIAQYASNSLPALIDLAKSDAGIEVNLVKALSMRNKDGVTARQIIDERAKDCIPRLYELRESRNHSAFAFGEKSGTAAAPSSLVGKMTCCFRPGH